MNCHPASPWPERDDELRALWAEGHSAAEIGRRMSLSKNAVVGRAHRLHLTPRPSPIKRTPADKRQAQAVRRKRNREMVEARGASTAPIAPVRLATGHSIMPVRELFVVSVQASQSAPTPVPRAQGRISECRWPTTNGSPWRYCDAPTVPGKSYCEAHCQIAYVPRQQRDAA